jgi:hypothetical protein
MGLSGKKPEDYARILAEMGDSIGKFPTTGAGANCYSYTDFLRFIEFLHLLR